MLTDVSAARTMASSDGSVQRSDDGESRLQDERDRVERDHEADALDAVGDQPAKRARDQRGEEARHRCGGNPRRASASH